MAKPIDRNPIAATIVFSSFDSQVLPVVEKLKAEAAEKLRALLTRLRESDYCTSSTRIKMPAVPTVTGVIQALFDWVEQNVKRSLIADLWGSLQSEIRMIWRRDELMKGTVTFVPV